MIELENVLNEKWKNIEELTWKINESVKDYWKLKDEIDHQENIYKNTLSKLHETKQE